MCKGFPERSVSAFVVVELSLDTGVVFLGRSCMGYMLELLAAAYKILETLNETVESKLARHANISSISVHPPMKIFSMLVNYRVLHIES